MHFIGDENANIGTEEQKSKEIEDIGRMQDGGDEHKSNVMMENSTNANNLPQCAPSIASNSPFLPNYDLQLNYPVVGDFGDAVVDLPSIIKHGSQNNSL